MVATGMIIEAQYVVQGESSRWGHEVLYAGERLSDRAPIHVRTVGPNAPKNVRQQFSAIASILSRVDDENCLSTLAAGQQLDGTLYLITLANDAGSLEALVGEGVPAREIAEIGLQMFEGLTHLHAQGIVLGFVAPTGVTLGQRHTQPRLQIVDYSIARFESSQQMPPSTAPKEWLAPEMQAGQPSSFAADVYSAGLVLSSLAAADVPTQISALLKMLVREDPAERPSASDAAAGFAAFVDASPVSFDLDWLPPASSSKLSSGVFRLAEELAEEILAEPVPTRVSVASVAASQPPPEPVVFAEAPRSRAVGIGLAVAGLLAAGVVAFVVTASPSEPASAPESTPTEDAGAAAVVAAPVSTGQQAPATPSQANDGAPEGNPIVWLSQVNRQDLGATLPYADRHRLLDELASREGVYEKVNQRWNAMLDLWQAGDTDRPCATFAAALASLDEPAQTDAERDLLGRVVVPVPAAGSHAGVGEDDSCEGLAEAFSELTESPAEVAVAEPRRKRRKDKSTRSTRPAPLPRKPAPPSGESKPPRKKKKKSSVATKLDDDLRGI